MRRETAILAALLAVFGVCEGVTFGRLCSSYFTNTIRSDSGGDGSYGASRTEPYVHKHRGVDIICDDWDTVYAPFDVTVTRKITVYPDPTEGQKAIDKGVQLLGGGLCFKIFYVDSDNSPGDRVWSGNTLGTMLPMQRAYPGITSHVHVEVCSTCKWPDTTCTTCKTRCESYVDPTGYF